ncbi:phage stabilization protein [Caudoviricetes sp.]|nr:phage stabilization protein [Caudoviricetes sp.]
MAVGSALLDDLVGVNLSKHPLKLADNELTLALNTYPIERGVPDMRPNGRLLGVAGIPPEDSTFDTDRAATGGLFQFVDDKGQYHLLMWHFRVGINEGVQSTVYIREILSQNMDGGNPINVDLSYRYVLLKQDGLILSDRPFLQLGTRRAFDKPGFIVRNGKLYIFMGTGPVLRLTAGENDVLDASLGGVGAAPSYWATAEFNWNVAVGGNPAINVNGNIVALHQNQICMAGVPGYPNYIFCSDPADTGDLSAVAPITRAISIGQSDDPIVALATIPITGGSAAVEPYLLVLKRRSTWMVQGALPDSTSDGSLKIVPLLRNEGCVSRSTVVDSEHGVIWCSGQNVWLMESGQEPRCIGADIAPYLKTLPAQSDLASAFWSAVYDPTLGCYRLITPRGLASDVMSQVENVCITYTVPQEQWWCDLRGLLMDQEEKPAWWGPMTLSGVLDQLEYRERGGPIIGLWMPLTHNGYSGTVPQPAPHLCVLSEFTPNRTDWSEYADWTQIEFPIQELRTKEFDFGDPFIEKIIEAVEVHGSYIGDANGALQVKVVKNMESFKSRMFAIKAGATAPSPTNNSMVLDAGKLGETTLGEAMFARAYTPESVSPERAVLRTGRFILQTTTGGSIWPRFRLYKLGLRVRGQGRRSTGADSH